MTRDELIRRTRQLIEEGERLEREPSLGALQLWLQLSDDLLAAAWGSMDRYHLAWLMVGKPKDIVRGRAMTPEEEARMADPIRAKYETEGHPYYGSARLWDDGVVDPLRTRDLLGLAFAAALEAPIPPPSPPVFRM